MSLFRSSNYSNVHGIPVLLSLIPVAVATLELWYILPISILLLGLSLLPSKYFPDFIRYKRVRQEDMVSLYIACITLLLVLFDPGIWYLALVVLELCIILSYWIVRYALETPVMISESRCKERDDSIQLPQEFTINNENRILKEQKAPVKITSNQGETFVVNRRPVIFGDTLIEISNQAKIYYL